MSKIAVLRIAGQVKNKIKDNETLSRLKLRKKFSLAIIDSKDSVRMGMVRAVSHMISYGVVSDAFVKELESKKDGSKGVYFMHPPRGGFKKSSKVAAPKGILGENKDIVKLLERMF
ncbi:MAG: hypothetical protein ABIF88_00385 [archaeon]